MDLHAAYNDRLAAHLDVAKQMNALREDVVEAVEMVVATLHAGGKLLLAGNGGSAADAQHWAAEWIVRLSHDLNRPSMPAIALTTDSSILTAGANDIGFDNIIARQIESLGQEGDLFIAISTSGNSTNLLKASDVAHGKSMRVLGILGRGGGKQAGFCDHSVIVPSDDTQRIQEMHAFIGHMLCELSERVLYGK